jgi:hypothetical protein
MKQLVLLNQHVFVYTNGGHGLFFICEVVLISTFDALRPFEEPRYNSLSLIINRV